MASEANEMRRVYIKVPLPYEDSEIDKAESEAGGDWYFQGHRTEGASTAYSFAQYYVDCANEGQISQVWSACQRRGWTPQFNDQF